MISKKHVIAFAILMLVIVPAVVILLDEDPYNDDWYKEELKQAAIDYIRQNEEITGKIQVSRYVYTDGLDYDIEESNRAKEQKVYPFKTITVIAQTRNSNFSVYFSVNADGELQVEKMEKEKALNLFF